MEKDGLKFRDPPLPVTGSLKPVYITSCLLAALLTTASLVGFFFSERIYPTRELLSALVPTDGINLATGLPLLFVSLILAGRGKLAGLICWTGALFYILYSYTAYLLGVPFGPLFPVYLLLVTLSLCGLIGLLVILDCSAVQEMLTGAVPAKTSGGILLGLGIFILLRMGALIAQALSSGRAVPEMEIVQWIDDFVIACPALLVTGYMLWRKKPLGYAAGGGLLLAYAVLSAGLVPLMFYQARENRIPVDYIGIIIVLIMAALCLYPFIFFIRGSMKIKTGKE